MIGPPGNINPKREILSHFNRIFHYKPSILGGLPPLFLVQPPIYSSHNQGSTGNCSTSKCPTSRPPNRPQRQWWSPSSRSTPAPHAEKIPWFLAGKVVWIFSVGLRLDKHLVGFIGSLRA